MSDQKEISDEFLLELYDGFSDEGKEIMLRLLQEAALKRKVEGES